MKTRYSYLLIFLIILSCYKIDRPKKPENLISKAEMITVLVDLSLMNSAKSVNKKIIEKNGIVPDEYIYKKHGIDSITFAASNDYYAYDINEYQDIYTKVKDSLTSLKKKYKAIEAKEKKKKKKQDSLKRLQKKDSRKLKVKKELSNKKKTVKT